MLNSMGNMLVYMSVIFIVLLAVVLSIYILVRKRRLVEMNQSLMLSKRLADIVSGPINANSEFIGLLRCVGKIVHASYYAIYLKEPKTQGYTLRAMRQQAQAEGDIAPSYSGLSPYIKDMYLIPAVLNESIIPNRPQVVRQKQAYMLLIPLNHNKAVITVGPIKRANKKTLLILEQMSPVMASIVNIINEEEAS